MPVADTCLHSELVALPAAVAVGIFGVWIFGVVRLGGAVEELELEEDV